MGRPRRFLTVMTALAAALSADGSLAQTPKDFYAGKTLSLVVSTPSGSGYDLLGRAVARHLGRHLPGEPTVVVRNMPGAGGILATNYMFSAAPKDGTVLASVQNNAPFEPLFGTAEAKYDPNQINWLGSPSYEVGLVTVWHGTKAETLEDARTRELTMGASGKNSTPSFYARLFNQLLGTKFKVIVGYAGQPEAFLAMERGELDGYPSVFYSSLVSTKPEWLKDGKVRLLLQYGPEREPDLPDVPFATDLIRSDEDRRLLETALAPLALGRPYLMPPGVPGERVEAVRSALIATFRDPEFLREVEGLGLRVNAPRTGAQIADTVRRAYAVDPTVTARLRRLISE